MATVNHCIALHHFRQSAIPDGTDIFININSEDLRVDLKFPEPRLLACELNDYQAKAAEGWWNKITEDELTKAVNDMVASAKRAMQGKQDLQKEAKRMLELQVAGVIVQNGGTLGYANDAPFKHTEDME